MEKMKKSENCIKIGRNRKIGQLEKIEKNQKIKKKIAKKF